MFLGNSGTEAVEGAIKLARHHTGRQAIIAFLGSFHGRTLGSLSFTASKARYRAEFGPLLPGVHHVPFGKAGLDHIEQVIFKHLVFPRSSPRSSSSPCRARADTSRAAGGFLARLRSMCDRHGIFLVADEVQSGVGRTGTMWAIEHDGVVPDVLLAGKGLASGLPLGAIVARADVMTWPPGSHGSTFGGNPVSCAAAGHARPRGVRPGADAAMGERLLSGLQADPPAAAHRGARSRADDRPRLPGSRHGPGRRAGRASAAASSMLTCGERTVQLRLVDPRRAGRPGRRARRSWRRRSPQSCPR